MYFYIKFYNKRNDEFITIDRKSVEFPELDLVDIVTNVGNNGFIYDVDNSALTDFFDSLYSEAFPRVFSVTSLQVTETIKFKDNRGTNHFLDFTSKSTEDNQTLIDAYVIKNGLQDWSFNGQEIFRDSSGKVVYVWQDR